MFTDAQFDGALMLKSLHQVPVPAMDITLAQVASVLKPGAALYVSEPIYGGALNEIVRRHNVLPHVRADGAHFVRPLDTRLLRRKA